VLKLRLVCDGMMRCSNFLAVTLLKMGIVFVFVCDQAVRSCMTLVQSIGSICSDALFARKYKTYSLSKMSGLKIIMDAVVFGCNK